MLRTVCCSLKGPHRGSPGGLWAVHDRCPRTGDCSHGGTARGKRKEVLGASTLSPSLGGQIGFSLQYTPTKEKMR